MDHQTSRDRIACRIAADRARAQRRDRLDQTMVWLGFVLALLLTIDIVLRAS